MEERVLDKKMECLGAGNIPWVDKKAKKLWMGEFGKEIFGTEQETRLGLVAG